MLKKPGIMRIDKEYPATHSMSTAWYFVDEDDNVAIFTFDDNGPIPETVTSDLWVSDLCFDKPVVEKGGIKYLNLTDEQVDKMVSGLWRTVIPDDCYWDGDIFLIDTDRTGEFLMYLRECRKQHGEKHPWDSSFIPVCMSEKSGIYMVDFNSYEYKSGLDNPFVKHLWERGIIRKYCMTPDYDFDKSDNLLRSCPYYLYENDWNPALPHERIAVPEMPVKLHQLPEEWRAKAIRLKIRFSDAGRIQIASLLLCFSSCSPEEVDVDGATYVLAYLPSMEKIYVLNNERNCNTEGLPPFLTEEQINKRK